MYMKATNIEWVTDGVDFNALPKEIEIPAEIENIEDEISAYLSDVNGFLHNGFALNSDLEG